MQQDFHPVIDYWATTVGPDGHFGSVGSIGVRAALRESSADGLMDLMSTMDTQTMTKSLREAGFAVPVSAIGKGRNAVFKSVEGALNDALDLGVDGFALAASRMASISEGSVSVSADEEVVNDVDAAMTVQRLMRAKSVTVDLLGDATPGARESLLLVAGQALMKDIQGFGFDGIPGKYQIPLSMAQVVELHRDAASAVAEQSARTGLSAWVKGETVPDVSDWVPDSVQRLLRGSVSMAAAQVLVDSLRDGAIANHAGEIGTHKITTVLEANGLNVHAMTVERQAEHLGLILKDPDRDRGQYFGPVVGLDHRAALVKYTRTQAVELPLVAVGEGQRRPEMGDSVRMAFKGGELKVSIAEQRAKTEVGR